MVPTAGQGKSQPQLVVSVLPAVSVSVSMDRQDRVRPAMAGIWEGLACLSVSDPPTIRSNSMWESKCTTGCIRTQDWHRMDCSLMAGDRWMHRSLGCLLLTLPTSARCTLVARRVILRDSLEQPRCDSCVIGVPQQQFLIPLRKRIRVSTVSSCGLERCVTIWS